VEPQQISFGPGNAAPPQPLNRQARREAPQEHEPPPPQETPQCALNLLHGPNLPRQPALKVGDPQCAPNASFPLDGEPQPLLVPRIEEEDGEKGFSTLDGSM
jgi:hypothetical protein